MNSYITLDLETTTNKTHNRVGNPWYNQIVAIGVKPEFAKERGIYIYEPKDIIANLRVILSSTKLLVGHNFKYDLLYLWGYREFQDWLLAGGIIWCTQLAEYLLTGQQSKYAKLRTIATEKYGCPTRPKHIDDLLFNKLEPNDYQEMTDLPPELVLEDVKNDVLDTESVYLQQRQKAKELGMERLIELQMDALLATCEIEFNGMKIDVKTMEKNKNSLLVELEQANNELHQIIERYWK